MPTDLPIARLTIPLIPPSVNSYARHTRSGGHYVTGEAAGFKNAIVLLARHQSVAAEHYAVTVVLYLGKGQRLDADNSLKCVLDGLQAAGVIASDSKITELHVFKRRDWERPRTEVTVSEAAV